MQHRQRPNTITGGLTHAGSLIDRIRTTEGALTVPRLAKLLSMSKQSLYDHVERGSLPAYRIGTAVRLDPVDTADWLLARCTAA